MKEKKVSLEAVLDLAAKRGMRVSKAAKKLGLDEQKCKAYSIASKINVIADEAGMIEAVKTHGHSCMSSSPLAYTYWARTTNSQNSYCMAVAIYGDSRCLIRTDNKTLCKAYGSQSGELLHGLEVLGYTCNPTAFSEELKIPKTIKQKTNETVTKTVYVPEVVDTYLRGVVKIPAYCISFNVLRYGVPCPEYKTVGEFDLDLYKHKPNFKCRRAPRRFFATIDSEHGEVEVIEGKYFHKQYGEMTAVRVKNKLSYKRMTKTKTVVKTATLPKPYHDGWGTFL